MYVYVCICAVMHIYMHMYVRDWRTQASGVSTNRKKGAVKVLRRCQRQKFCEEKKVYIFTTLPKLLSVSVETVERTDVLTLTVRLLPIQILGAKTVTNYSFYLIFT